jgi:hypothetical protein
MADATPGATVTVQRGGKHCKTCDCLPPRTDTLIVYPQHGIYGECLRCGVPRWETELYHYRTNAARRSSHCRCCTHLHDLEPGSYYVPTRGAA